MSQNLIVIGQGTSEIWRSKLPERKKEKSAVKHKSISMSSFLTAHQHK